MRTYAREISPPWLLMIGGVSRTLFMVDGSRSEACVKLNEQILNTSHYNTYSLCKTKSIFNRVKSLHNSSERQLVK